MSEIISYCAPHYKVLVVAVKRIDGRKEDGTLLYCWQALIKDVPGESHEREIESVKDYGNKLPEHVARAFFPRIDEQLGGKLRYAY